MGSPRRNRTALAWEIGVALVFKLCLIYVIWAAWFSQPMAQHMQMDDNAVARAVLSSRPVNTTGESRNQTPPTSVD